MRGNSSCRMRFTVRQILILTALFAVELAAVSVFFPKQSSIRRYEPQFYLFVVVQWMLFTALGGRVIRSANDKLTWGSAICISAAAVTFVQAVVFFIHHGWARGV
jgi:hypothetical protein